MKKETNAIFAQKLSALIKKKGLSVSQTASRVGMNKTTLHNYCNGAIPRNLDSLLKLARFFEVSLDQMLSDAQSSPKDLQVGLAGDYVVSIRPLRKTDGSA